MAKVDTAGEARESKMDLLKDEISWKWNDGIDTNFYDFEEHVKENFLEVFDEQSSYKDNKIGQTVGDVVIRKAYRTVFVYVAAGVYYFFAVVLGIILSVVWAIVFGINQFAIVWVMQPTVKLLYTWVRIWAMIIRSTTRMALDPFFQSWGQALSFIRGRFRLNVRAPHVSFGDDRALLHEL